VQAVVQRCRVGIHFLRRSPDGNPKALRQLSTPPVEINLLDTRVHSACHAWTVASKVCTGMPVPRASEVVLLDASRRPADQGCEAATTCTQAGGHTTLAERTVLLAAAESRAARAVCNPILPKPNGPPTERDGIKLHKSRSPARKCSAALGSTSCKATQNQGSAAVRPPGDGWVASPPQQG